MKGCKMTDRFFSFFPRHFVFIGFYVFLLALLLSFFRVVFFFVFRQPSDPMVFDEMFYAFYLGLKFDVRLLLLVHLPLLLFGGVSQLGIGNGGLSAKLWKSYLTFTFFMMVLLYVIDFAYYGYLQSRLDASSLRFLQNPLISLQMVWQSYPLFWGMSAIFFFAVIIWFLIGLMVRFVYQRKFKPRRRLVKTSFSILFVLLYVLGIYGKISWYPLRWSDAFFSQHQFACALSLNPVLYVYDTFKNREVTYSEEKVRESYEMMADYLGVDKPDSETLNFSRFRLVEPKEPPPNVVIILLESFAYYKTGILGNPLDPTPHFDAIAEKGYLFSRYYSCHPGTARSVFTLLTGLPDVELNKTSTRNPLIVKQHTIVNAFRGYEKYFFLGGSANWGNIRGILQHNIPDLRLYEEGNYSSPRSDVWGISDLHLMEEANNVLKASKGPFISIIMTAGNHRPYTIPDDSRHFEKLIIDEELVQRHGFDSMDEYNSFRFMDHCIGLFFDWASQTQYFENTIFVLFGDHGIPGSSEKMLPAEEQLQLTKYHVPLLIYSPRFEDTPRVIDKIASETDVLPTVAALAGVSYQNTTFGRDLFDAQYDEARYAFTIIHRANPIIGLLDFDHYFLMNADGTEKKLHSYFSDSPRVDESTAFPEKADSMAKMCAAYYETACYMRYHNGAEIEKKDVSTAFQEELPQPKME